MRPEFSRLSLPMVGSSVVLSGLLAASIMLGGWQALPAAPPAKTEKKPVEITQPVTETAPTSTVTPAVTKAGNYTQVGPLDLVKKPADYLNRSVEFEGTFNSFATLGLDYNFNGDKKPVKEPGKADSKPENNAADTKADAKIDDDANKRDSNKFISVLILRPDVTHHHIPLSELKLFYPRQKSEDILELESGDQIRVQGKVFSTALGDPWMDIETLKVVKKAPKPVNKETPATAPKS